MRRLMILAALLFSLACGSSSAPPPPPPTTTLPPARDILAFPLGIAGPNFVDATGRPIVLWPIIECCWDKQATGWPGIRAATLQEAADSGANAVMIRLGPHSNRKGAPDPEAAPGTGWLAAQADTCHLARQLGVACILSIVDCWGIRTGNNFYGWAWSILETEPRRDVEWWVQQSLTPFLGLDNVLVETGNECFAFDPPSKWRGVSVAWDLGLRDMIRARLPRALIGTNSHLPRAEREFDFVLRHSETFIEAPHENKPTMVVEYKTLTPERWEQNAVAARARGTVFSLWVGDMSQAQRQDALARMRRLAL